MDGGCTSIWLKRPMTFAQKKIIYRYESYLASLGQMKIHSFYWKLKPADGFTKYEQQQFRKYLGSEIKEELVICGLADPLFRAVEAIMQTFGWYYKYEISEETEPYLKGKYFTIRKRNKLGVPVYAYHILDWQFIAAYFNRMDENYIRYVYDIDRLIFESN